ncbi:MAG TPA: phosphopantetheine-binding protein, partial [Bacillota bacterium]|nr:phosphopantetheine-binding protein [Bacillota bacterium]
EYMVPTHIVALEEFPMTSSGKLDRKALPAPDVSQKAPAPAIVELRNPMERQIAECWQDLLRSEAIGLDDNFFDLGGHSLLAVQAQARLEERLGIKFPVIKIFQNPTVRSLARCLGKNPSEHVPAARIQDRAQKQRAAFGLGARKKEMSL